MKSVMETVIAAEGEAKHPYSDFNGLAKFRPA